ncbi:MAG: HAMP domain-containing histidine kinase [Bacteroidetes bacterium]|nr:HAMP domain-containing histidine kinase [Bacteroidota bacterium]
MHKRFGFIFLFLVGYIIIQFLWWETLLVKQSNDIIREKQKLVALNSSNPGAMHHEIDELEHRRMMKVYMFAGEGTVFLLILLYGAYKVRQAMRKESELTGQQKNFILSVSHELKTPIAATKLQLQTLLRHELDRDKQKQLLNNALQETNRLNKLIEDVLLANQIENSNLSIHKETFDFSETTQQQLHNYFGPYLDKGELTMAVQPGITVLGDKTLLPSVLINLVENAIKYSFDHIRVHVSLTKEAQAIVLQVKDNGSGINAPDKDKIFEKFFRSGHEDTRRTKGTGLGLYIVKQVVTAHNGRITVDSNHPSGSIFTVYL